MVETPLELEQENQRLERIVAEQTLDIEILKELNRQLGRSDATRSAHIVPMQDIREV